jgi:hypothetical protein
MGYEPLTPLSLWTAFRNRHETYGSWLANEWTRFHWTWRGRTRRLRNATSYLLNRMDERTAREISYDCEEAAGQFPLVSITTDDVLESAENRFEAHPQLRSICAEAASYVAGKWNSSGDELYAAVGWAVDKVQEYAANDGVELVELDSDENEEESDDE